MSKEVMRQALDALEKAYPQRSAYIDITSYEADCAKHGSAISALRAAIAHPESAPYAYEYELLCNDSMGQGWEQRFARKIPSYQTVQNVKPLYAAPVQSAYVSLTDAQIYDMGNDGVFLGSIYEIVRAIEKAVREKA